MLGFGKHSNVVRMVIQFVAIDMMDVLARFRSAASFPLSDNLVDVLRWSHFLGQFGSGVKVYSGV